MGELKEKRDYYDDRSLKAVYYVDEQGRKQGNYTEYEQNSDKIKQKLEYKDDTVWNGKANTENGYIEYEKGKIIAEAEDITNYYGEKIGYVLHDFKNNAYYKEEKHSHREEKITKKVHENGEELYYHFSDIDLTVWSPVLIRTYTLYKGKIEGEHAKIEAEHREHYNGWSWDFQTDGVRAQISGRIWKRPRGGSAYKSWETKCFATFENGIPVGEYRMPLGSFSEYFPVKIVGDHWKKILNSLPMLERKHFYPQVLGDIIADGIWKDGKFTGKARNRDHTFSAQWDNGEMTAKYYENGTSYNWHDGICEVRCHDGDIVEKYTLRNGLKHGLYTREPYAHYRRTEKEESEYKDGKLHGMSRKYNVKGWLESEIQYQDGKKHGFEKLYNSDGTVASIKYYQNGRDCTAKYNRLKKIASKHIEEEDKLSEGKNKRVVLKRKTKLGKMIDFAKESIKEKLHVR